MSHNKSDMIERQSALVRSNHLAQDSMDKRKATTSQWPWWKPEEAGKGEATDATLQVPAVGLELLLHGG